LDIQKLTMEQGEELIEDLMALKDVVGEEEVDSIRRRILFSVTGEKCAPVAVSKWVRCIERRRSQYRYP